MLRKLSVLLFIPLILLCAIPVGAISAGDPSLPLYYSAIPFDTVLLTGFDDSSWILPFYGDTYNLDVQDQALRNEDYATVFGEYLLEQQVTVGGLTTTANLDIRHQVVDRGTFGIYRSGNNQFGFSSWPKSITFVAHNFEWDVGRYNNLVSYGRIYVPSGVNGVCTISCDYYTIDLPANVWVQSSSSVSGSFSASNPRPYRSGLFGDSASDSMYVSSLEITFTFDTQISSNTLVGFYLPYTDVAPTYVPSSTVVTEYVPVAPEDLDLWSWIIRPVQSFLGVELYPDISIGGVFGVMLAAAVVFAVLYFVKG